MSLEASIEKLGIKAETKFDIEMIPFINEPTYDKGDVYYVIGSE